jgi:ribonucrease Y
MWVIFWMALSVVLFYIWENRKTNKAQTTAEHIIKKAEHKRDKILTETRRETTEIIKKTEKIEERILDREEKIENKLEHIEEKYDHIAQREEELKNERDKLKDTRRELDGKLEEISNLTEKDARKLFMAEIKEKYKDEALDLIKKYKKKTEDSKKEAAREIILKSIQQYAGDVTSEVTTTVIEIPSDDIKGKLIGKEWRNITTFEKTAGVALIIDDTPNSVFISAFDLFRRYIAKKSLEKLIEDGRIQPARIEEVIAKTEEDAHVLLTELWNKVVDELGITTIPDEMIPIVWKLRFRTSYGQNIIKHSKEVALIAEQLARDLWADPYICKVGWLLHDIWKALDQEYEGTHPEIWAKLARKYQMDDKVVDMIENHHGEQFSISLEAAIVQVADAISSVRPGARREVIEDYLKRVQEMEALVQSFSGVSKAYALSAWREIRVFVDAVTVSDLDAQEMAKEIAEKIQDKLSYPGEVKVNLIRESRVIEFAK